MSETVDARRRLPDESDAGMLERHLSATGRMIWLDKQDCRGAFGEDESVPETVWTAAARVGEKSGTYFKTARTHDGMAVWRWGGRDTEPTP